MKDSKVRAEAQSGDKQNLHFTNVYISHHITNQELTSSSITLMHAHT